MTVPADRMTDALLRETSRLARTLEGERRFYLRWLLALVLATIMLVTGAVFQLDLYPRQLVIIMGSLFISVPVAQVLNWLYRRKGKRVFTAAMAQTAGLRYDPTGIFPVSAAAKHKILPAFDRDQVEDGFEGTYDGVPVAFQEVHLSGLENIPSQPRSRKREYTAFWGMLIRIRLQRPVEGHTVVIPRTALYTVFRTSFSEFQKVNAPSKFEKKYHILSTDQVEARVVMDPAFMERFLEAAQIMRAHWMEVSFRDNEILFAVQRFRPLFEVGHLWQPVTPEYLRKLADHIDAVDRMIDVLKLNRQIGLG